MNKSTTQKHASDLLQGDIGATLKRMTIPMILGMVMMMSFGLIDTFFVSLLGTDPLAAISFTFPVTFTVISLNIGLGIGTSAIIGLALTHASSASLTRISKNPFALVTLEYAPASNL